MLAYAYEVLKLRMIGAPSGCKTNQIVIGLMDSVLKTHNIRKLRVVYEPRQDTRFKQLIYGRALWVRL